MFASWQYISGYKAYVEGLKWVITSVAYQLKQVSHAAARFKMLSVVGVNQFWCVAAVTVQTEQQNLSLMSTTPITTHK